jgi:hypothetical protein
MTYLTFEENYLMRKFPNALDSLRELYNSFVQDKKDLWEEFKNKVNQRLSLDFIMDGESLWFPTFKTSLITENKGQIQVHMKTNKEMQEDLWNSTNSSLLQMLKSELTEDEFTKAEKVLGKISATAKRELQQKCQDVAQEHFNFVSYGQHDASWLWFYKYFAEVCNIDGIEECLKGLWQVAETCGWWWAEKDLCVITSKPIELHRDEQHRLHNTEGPAMRYPASETCPNGWCLWAVHGVRVTEQIIMAPETLTPKQILEEANVEVRRVMLERFGDERFVREAGLVSHGKDDFGEVFIQEFDNDEPLVLVKVVNSTPEPDGSFRDYYLRVDPNAYNGKARNIGRAAVASTWRYPDGEFVFSDYNEYAPLVET